MALSKFKRHRIIILIFIISGTILNSCALITGSSKKDYEDILLEKPYDVIIVPGMPFYGEKWSVYMKARVFWSHHLYTRGIAKNIIYSGSSVYSPYVESKVMALYASELGIPRQNIFVETKAEYSCENLYYSYKMARQLGFKKIALASDPFQTEKLEYYSEKFGFTMDFIPIVFDTLAAMQKWNPKIDASEAYVPDHTPITARDNWFTRLKGTLGFSLSERLIEERKREQEANLN